jgi:hypothetical protein
MPTDQKVSPSTDRFVWKVKRVAFCTNTGGERLIAPLFGYSRYVFTGGYIEMVITQQHLQKVLDYDPDTGIWKWKQAPRHSPQLVNQAAGTLTNQGTRRIQINGRSYYAHQLAFLYVLGKWPKGEIDHINHVPDDNRWLNLRESNSHENSCNRRKPKSNTSGYKNVSWHKRKQKFESKIQVTEKTVHLGVFKSLELAVWVADEAAIRYHGDCAVVNHPQCLI